MQYLFQCKGKHAVCVVIILVGFRDYSTNFCHVFQSANIECKKLANFGHPQICWVPCNLELSRKLYLFKSSRHQSKAAEMSRLKWQETMRSRRLSAVINSVVLLRCLSASLGWCLYVRIR